MFELSPERSIEIQALLGADISMQLDECLKLPANREEMAKMPVTDQVLFLQVAQSMEMLGILVADRYIDLELVEKTMGSFVSSAWEKFKALSVNARPSDPYLNEYWQWLAQQMTRRMTENPRKPFHELNAPPS